MRLIDADELTNKFLGYYTEKERQGDVTFSACEIKQGFADMVEEAPTINPEDLRPKGKWIWDDNAIDWGIGAWVCSECHCRNDNIHAEKNENPYVWSGSKHCPNCGVKMEG